MSTAPKVVGAIGHPKFCECVPCVRRKVRERLARINDPSRLRPTSLDQTVAVRAHWRRQNNHLKKQPKVLDALTEALRKMMKEDRR